MWINNPPPCSFLENEIRNEWMDGLMKTVLLLARQPQFSSNSKFINCYPSYITNRVYLSVTSRVKNIGANHKHLSNKNRVVFFSNGESRFESKKAEITYREDVRYKFRWKRFTIGLILIIAGRLLEDKVLNQQDVRLS